MAKKKKLIKKATVKTKLRVSPNGGPQTHAFTHKRKWASFSSLREAWLEVFNKLGGAEGLYKFVASSPANKKLFYITIAKMLPKEIIVSNPSEGPEQLPFVIQLTKAKEEKKVDSNDE